MSTLADYIVVLGIVWGVTFGGLLVSLLFYMVSVSDKVLKVTHKLGIMLGVVSIVSTVLFCGSVIGRERETRITTLVLKDGTEYNLDKDGVADIDTYGSAMKVDTITQCGVLVQLSDVDHYDTTYKGELLKRTFVK